MSTEEYLIPPSRMEAGDEGPGLRPSEAKQWWQAQMRVLAKVAPLIPVSAYGAVGDGVTDDSDAIEAAVAAAAAVSGTLVFTPGATYLLFRTLYGASRIRWEFNNTTFKATNLGTYDDILDNVGADTGLDVFFSVVGAFSSHHGRLTIDGSQVSNLCGLSSATTAGQREFQYWESLNIISCERAIFALNQASNGNTIVGHHFDLVECRSNGYDLYVIGSGLDDTTFNVFRSHGSSFAPDAGKANIFLLDAPASFNVASLFLDGSRADRHGLVLNNGADVICDHMFIEHEFDEPIRITNSENLLRVQALKVSPAFSSTNGTIIQFLGNDLRGYYDVAFTIHVTGTSGVSTLVRLALGVGLNQRVVRLRLPFGTGAKTPVTYAGGGANIDDLVEVTATNGVFRYFYDGVTTTAVRQDTYMGTRTGAVSTLGNVTDRIEVFDTMGNSLGFVPVYDSIT